MMEMIHMAKYLNVEYEFEDNDASFAEFGWDFQSNAGLYLFLHFIKEANSVIIESKNQDIEIELTDRILYAQAKALQDENTINTENAKLRDALVSLAKVNSHLNDKLVYISNLCAPINKEKDRFRNDMVAFKNCSPEIRNFILQQMDIIINNIKKKLDNAKLSKRQRNKNKSLLHRLENFDFDNFYIASIYPFAQDGDRYKVIKSKSIETLTDIMEIDSERVMSITGKIMRQWQAELKFNATIADKGNDRRSISKSKFVWTVIALYGDNIPNEKIRESLSDCIESTLDDECRRYMESDRNIYHERFEFMNKVLSNYEKFKSTVQHGQHADIAYIKSDEWQQFSNEFNDIEYEPLREYVTKSYMLKFVRRNREFLKIQKGVNLCS